MQAEYDHHHATDFADGALVAAKGLTQQSRCSTPANDEDQGKTQHKENSVGVYVAATSASTSPTNVVINYNNIENNDDYGVLNLKYPESGDWNYWDYESFLPADSVVDASLNWWGTSDHLLIADMVLGDVLYTPCLDKSLIALDVNVVPAVVSISVSPMIVNFGSIIFGGDSLVKSFTVTNSGNVAADMTADIESEWYQTYLHIDGVPYDTGWTLTTIPADSSDDYDLQLVGVEGLGTYSGVLVFTATPPPPPP